MLLVLHFFNLATGKAMNGKLNFLQRIETFYTNQRFIDKLFFVY